MTTTIIPGQDSELEPGSSVSEISTAGHARQRFIWWEKTVEYCYALNHLRDYRMICPLDGNFERAGDVIMRKAAQWCLIEFKRYGPTKEEKLAQGVIKVEDDKFKGAEEARDRLRAHVMKVKPQFHHIVYGRSAKADLQLEAHDYWNCTSSRGAEALLSDAFTCDETSFYDYVSLFMRAKGGKSGDSGSDRGGAGGGAPPGGGPTSGPQRPSGTGAASSKQDEDFDFTSVLALTTDGEILCCPLRSFYGLLASSKDLPPSREWGDGGQHNKPGGPQGKGDGGVALPMSVAVIDTRIRYPAPSFDDVSLPLNVPIME